MSCKTQFHQEAKSKRGQMKKDKATKDEKNSLNYAQRFPDQLLIY